MKTKFWFLFAMSAIVPASDAFAKLNVIATVTDLRAIVAEVGGEFVSVESIAKGTQDPHYIEAKPSFMLKLNRADLVVAIGLDLEIGWLPSVVRGARNPRINPGQPGFLEVGPLVNPVDVLTGKVTRAEGDVHPFGNPHVTLDPLRAGEIAVKIAERLGQLDPGHASDYAKNAHTLKSRLEAQTKIWKTRIDQSGVKKVVSYHKTLTYFFQRFQIENPAILEPKPGIPPTSGHILEVIQLIRTQRIPLILVENYFDPTVTKKVRDELPAVRSQTVAVAVDGAPGVVKIDDLYEHLVKAIEGK